MEHALRPSAIVPDGFAVESAVCDGGTTLIMVRPTSNTSACPRCGTRSDRIHSRYLRHATDLPLAGRPVRLVIVARRFRCDAALCSRRIFTERFDGSVLALRGRRTARLDYVVHHLGLALGGRPAASFARRLMIPVSNDSLLRLVRRRRSASLVRPSVVGIDDWAWKRNQRYGTIVCDLERRKPVTLLPDRAPATAEAWFCGQPQITVVARDRGGGYALAAARALPHATQIADRWHLMENASRAFLEAVQKSMRQIRSAIGATTIDPSLLTAAERIQYEGYLRREEANAAILGLAKEGIAIKEIVRRTGHSRGLVRAVLRGRHSDVFRARQSSLEPYLQWLDAQWAAGHRNGAALWRHLKTHGFHGSLRVVTEWATRRRRAEKADAQSLQRTPSARTIARLMTIGRDTLSKSETITIAAIEDKVPLLVQAREIIAAFHAMIRQKSRADLDVWLEQARASLVASFANGVTKDKAAVTAAITRPWSNGQTEGQITKLKLVKRQMYGRPSSQIDRRDVNSGKYHRDCVGAQYPPFPTFRTLAISAFIITLDRINIASHELRPSQPRSIDPLWLTEPELSPGSGIAMLAKTPAAGGTALLAAVGWPCRIGPRTSSTLRRRGRTSVSGIYDGEETAAQLSRELGLVPPIGARAWNGLDRPR
jgi:transposase